jgi:CrcB protein
MLATYLWVALGGALGSMARFGMGGAVAAWLGPGYPWGTIFINIIGSFVIGFYGALSGPTGAVPGSLNARSFVLVGLCGGFTTFSAFSLQTFELAQQQRWWGAAGNVVISVVVCLIAVWAGVAFARAFGGPPLPD